VDAQPKRTYQEVANSIEEFARSDTVLLTVDLMRKYSGRGVAAYQGTVITASEDLAELQSRLLADKIPLSTVAIRFIGKDGIAAQK
jgi:hypothetical protein